MTFSQVINPILASASWGEVGFEVRTGTFFVKRVDSKDFLFNGIEWSVNDEGPVTGQKITIFVENHSFEDALGVGERGELFLRTESNLEVRLEVVIYEKRKAIAFRIGVHNEGDESIRIKRMSPLVRGKFSEGQINLSTLRYLDGRCGGGESKVTVGPEIACENNLLATFCEIGSGKRRSIVIGGLSYMDFAKYCHAFYDEISGDITLSVEAQDSRGRQIDPGEIYQPDDRFYLGFGEDDPFLALEAYGLALRKANRARPNTYDFPTVCGWYSSMAAYGGGPYINDSPGMLSEAKAANRVGLTRYSRVACRLVPDTYDASMMGPHVDKDNFHPSIFSADKNTEQGWWDDEHWQRFGHLREPYETTAKWGNAMDENGALPFIYVQSGLVSYDFAQAHPEYMLGNDISRLDEPVEGGRPNVTYDYTDPEFREHLRSTWKALKKSGIRGVMFDYPDLAWHDEGRFDDKNCTTASAYRSMFALAKEGLGPDSWIQERNVKKRWPHYVDIALGVVDSQRICSDTDRATPELYERCALRWYKNRVVYALDTDAKHFHKVVPGNRDGVRQMLTMLYVVSGRLLLSHTTGWLKPEQVHDLSRVLPFHCEPKSARPLDAFTQSGCPRIYDFQVDENWHQVTFYNSDDKNAQTITVALGRSCSEGGLGLDMDRSYYVYDFWNDALIGRIKGNRQLEQTLRAGEARMMSVHKVVDHPQFLSTNRHVMQGFVDLHEVAWDAQTNVLSGESDVIGGEPYEIIIAANGYALEEISARDTGASIEGPVWFRDVFRLRLQQPESGRTRWKLKFTTPGTDHKPDSNLFLRKENLGHFNGDDNKSWFDHVSLGVELAGGRMINSYDPRFLKSDKTRDDYKRWVFSDTRGSLDLILEYRIIGPSSVILRTGVLNQGSESIALETLFVCNGRRPGQGLFGQVIPNAKYVGYLEDNEKIYRPEPGRTYHNSYWTLTVENPRLATGFLTGCHNINRFSLGRIGNDLSITAFGECSGVLLPPGETRWSDELFLSAESCPLAEMERFADIAAETNGVKKCKSNFATWCSWYSGWIGRQKQQYLKTWKGGLEKGVEDQIPFIASRFKYSGGSSMRIVDDSREMSLGDWDDSTEKIPHGYSRLAEMMSREGVRPGYWIPPFFVGTASKLFRDHPEWLARTQNGEFFLPGYAGIPCGILDTSIPEAAEHMHQVMKKLRKRGFDYIMTDFLTAQFNAPRFREPTMTPVEVHRKALKEIRAGLGNEVYWLGCTAFPGPCMGLVDGFRVSGDSFCGYTRKDGIFSYVQSGMRWFYHRRLWLNDPDSVITRGKWDFKAREYNREPHPRAYLEGYFSWIALSGSVITYGDTFDDDLPAECLEVYERIFPPLDIAGRPLDIWENNPFHLWGVCCSENPEHGQLFGAFSYYDEDDIKLEVNLDEVFWRTRGYGESGPVPQNYIVWDFWRKRRVATPLHTMSMALKPRTGALYSLHPHKERPQLIGTSGHFSQGALELPDLSFKPGDLPGTGCLKGSLHGNTENSFQLYFHVPGHCRVERVLLGSKPCKHAFVDSEIVRVTVQTSMAEKLPFEAYFTGCVEKVVYRPHRDGKVCRRISQSIPTDLS